MVKTWRKAWSCLSFQAATVSSSERFACWLLKILGGDGNWATPAVVHTYCKYVYIINKYIYIYIYYINTYIYNIIIAYTCGHVAIYCHIASVQQRQLQSQPFHNTSLSTPECLLADWPRRVWCLSHRGLGTWNVVTVVTPNVTPKRPKSFFPKSFRTFSEPSQKLSEICSDPGCPGDPGGLVAKLSSKKQQMWQSWHVLTL